jgi:hypothetical protein
MSAKVHEIRANPLVALTVNDDSAAVQLRMEGHAEIVETSPSVGGRGNRSGRRHRTCFDRRWPPEHGWASLEASTQ